MSYSNIEAQKCIKKTKCTHHEVILFARANGFKSKLRLVVVVVVVVVIYLFFIKS